MSLARAGAATRLENDLDLYERERAGREGSRDQLGRPVSDGLQAAAGAPAEAMVAQLKEELRQAQETLSQTEEVLRFKDRHIEQLENSLAGMSKSPAPEVPSSVREEELQAALRAKDMELVELQQQLENQRNRLDLLGKERGEIRARVTKMLSRL
ncbi:MAG: hypothetical protein HYR55_12565 [Acidobacteria bacterium]|nr:hypothetical protein [Acidobacteriota bacterium]MBI3656532.1 hypothetical protein [Acidobacteriota bacterium]